MISVSQYKRSQHTPLHKRFSRCYRRALLQIAGTLCLSAWTASLFAADCSAIFPDAVSSSGNGSISFGWQSRIYNSPDNFLDTTNLQDNSGGVSCNGSACSSTGFKVPTADYNGFPGGQPDVTLNSQQQQTISAGSYNNISLGYQAQLTMNPGTYVLRGSLDLGAESQIIVASPGTVVIYVRGDITLQNLAVINSAGGSRYVFLYARGAITLNSSSSANAILYARNNVVLQNGAQVTGAITSRRDIALNSASYVSYSASAVANTSFGSYCTVATFPNLVGEWRLDSATWSGSNGEVLDNSGNGLNGRAVNLNGLPTTSNTDPAKSGNPGTCRYGVFNGTSSGYVQIDDPGTNSILDRDQYTVSTWFYERSRPASDLMTIVSKDTNWEFHIDPGGHIYWWWGGGAQSLTSSSTVSLNSWHHLAITYRPGAQVMYLDGAVVGTNTDSNTVTYNNDAIYIGTDLAIYSRRFDGYIDEVRIYDDALSATQVATVMNATHTCVGGPVLDHFDIDVNGGSGSVCSPQKITITARDSSNAVVTGYTGTVNLSTSRAHGDWALTGTASDAQGTLSAGGSDAGTASYTFVSGDQGDISLNLSDTHAETLTITAADSSASVSSTSANLTFSENAFVVSSIDSLASDVIAGRRHQFKVEMVKRDPVNGDCSVASNYNAAAVKVWLTRGAADPGGAAPTLRNAALSSSVSLPNAVPASNNLSLPFVNGSANFNMDTSDVGQYSLQFRDDSNSFASGAIDGSSSTLTARPFAFLVTASGNPNPNPGATSDTGPVFTTAGADFGVSATAKGWAAADDSNDDGVPDIYADSDNSNNTLLTGATLLSFGLENPAQHLSLSSSLIQPVGGTPSALSSSATPPANGLEISTFSSGVGSTASVYYPEVGIIQINAAVTGGNYLGATAAATAKSNSASRNVGRFIPANFVLTGSSTLTPACATGVAYSYLGEPFDVHVELEAHNALGAVTTNYKGNFARLSNSLGGVSFTGLDDAAPTYLNSRVEHNPNDDVFNWASGVGTLNTKVDVARAANGVPDGPFNQFRLGAAVLDADSVAFASSALDLDSDGDSTNDSAEVGQGVLRYGRLRLDSAFGPETAALPVTFVTEYWNGLAFVGNADDSCTTINQSAISYPSGSIDTIGNRTVAIGGGSTTGTYSDDSGLTIHFSSGDAGQTFSAPGAGNTGNFSVNVDLGSYPWLRYDWNKDGDYSDAALPAAGFSFGSYRGNDRVIFWQEVFDN